MRDSEFWKRKHKSAEEALKRLPKLKFAIQRQSPVKKAWGCQWQAAYEAWKQAVHVEQERRWIEGRIAFYQERILALQNMNRYTRTLKFPSV